MLNGGEQKHKNKNLLTFVYISDICFIYSLSVETTLDAFFSIQKKQII